MTFRHYRLPTTPSSALPAFQIRNIRLHQFGLTRSTNTRDDLDVRKNAEISKRLLLTTVKHALSVSLYEGNLLVEKQMGENVKDDGRKS